MQKMKYSGVEWIGEIPEDWEVKKNKYILYNASELATPISLTLKNQTIIC